jgi:hypothetical protein
LGFTLSLGKRVRHHMSLNGTYEIVEMEHWDKEDIDLVEPGYIRISGMRRELHFICVDAGKSCITAQAKVTATGMPVNAA